jgi:hypothetical protein
LLGSIVYCITLVTQKKFVLDTGNHQQKIHIMNRYIQWLALLAILTGTLLVYPRHFTFHTPWIQTAYALVILFAGSVGLLAWLAKKHYVKSRWVWLVMYLFLGSILVIAVHDAVTKTSFIT